MPKILAHSPHKSGRLHLLKEHLASVASLAKRFSGNWRGGQEAELAGLLHDFGKYGDLFQARLRGEVSGLDHWSQGAWLALTEYQTVAAALAIQGHHIGLQCFQGLRALQPESLIRQHPLNLRLSEANLDVLKSRLIADDLQISRPETSLFKQLSKGTVGGMLEIRRLFSALVDADFLDTEAHFNGTADGKVYRQSGPLLDSGQALRHVIQELDRLERESTTPEITQEKRVQESRRTLREACWRNAESDPGLFTLTAPTGSGKTLAMLAFALCHAERHNLDRVVMVIPYLSIIEQTASIYRDILESHFGSEYLLEHHSMASLGEETSTEDANDREDKERRRRLLAENWDAPLIVTTSVQMLESLFSNRPSACRKLHRLANAVILFDEVQTLPLKLAVPTLAALSHMVSEWGSSVVFATATQPAFDHLHEIVSQQISAGWCPQEITDNSREEASRLRRVEYQWHMNSEYTWNTLADRLSKSQQVLCIVNTKSHASTLWEALAAHTQTNDVFHLSTNMCPLHRQHVLAEVRKRLDLGLPCRLVATQCVEAGVDLDFPEVWRALAPLDAVIQAAGRCNREGKLPHLGTVHVFLPEEEHYPDRGYQQAALITKALLKEKGDEFDPNSPELIRNYYQRLYDLSQPETLNPELTQHIKDLDFPAVAREYRLIREDAINILVCWEKKAEEFEKLKGQAEQERLNAQWIRQARGLGIGLYRPRPDEPIWDSLIPVEPRPGSRWKQREDWFICDVPKSYDADLGFIAPASLNLWIA